jgi:glycosyltransferase involved in cell wall biosynthesis
LKGMAEEAGVSDRIVWTGMLGETDKYGAIRGAEAFILPSHQENFGIAVAEALSCGVPTLITKKINIWREISDLGAGLVEADTLEGTETMLRNWLALSPDEKEKMAINAKACYEKNFTVEGCVAEFIQMFERAVTASPTQQK